MHYYVLCAIMYYALLCTMRYLLQLKMNKIIFRIIKSEQHCIFRFPIANSTAEQTAKQCMNADFR